MGATCIKTKQALLLYIWNLDAYCIHTLSVSYFLAQIRSNNSKWELGS